MERRNTVQKELVLDAVRTLMNHATAEEVYSYISKNHPSVSRGTVYRNLNILAQEKQILKVEVPEGPDHFDHNLHKHFHMNCTICKRVFDVKMKNIDINDYLEDSDEYSLLDYDIVFKGICSNCQKKDN